MILFRDYSFHFPVVFYDFMILFEFWKIEKDSNFCGSLYFLASSFEIITNIYFPFRLLYKQEISPILEYNICSKQNQLQFFDNPDSESIPIIILASSV